MSENLDHLIEQITQLPQAEKNKIFNLLLYQKSNASEKDIELIKFMTASNERLKKWLERTDKLVEKTDDLIDDITRST